MRLINPRVKKAGDIESVYKEYVDDLYSFGIYLGFNSTVVMDAIHDVFYKLLDSKKMITEINDRKSYLLRALKNNLINLSQKKSEGHLPIDVLSQSKDDSKDIQDRLIVSEDKELIHRKIKEMLGSLTAKQREIVYLRYVQEYNYNKIAEVLNITPSSCRKLIHKAMLTLRKKYPSSMLLFLFI